MRLFSKLAAQKLLAATPGPSPWYYGPKRVVPSRKGPLRWDQAGQEDAQLDKIQLRGEDQRPLLLLGMCCYAWPIPPHRLLVWYDRFPRSGSERGFIHLLLLDADELLPMDDSPAVCREMDRNGVLIRHVNGEVSSTEISSNRDAGIYPVDLPAPFRGIGEHLMLGDSSWSQRETHVTLFVLDTGAGTLAVYPQDWFNHGGFDYGYQWITRVARDPKSGRVIGDGMRMGVFELDESNRQIKRWLVKRV